MSQEKLIWLTLIWPTIIRLAIIRLAIIWLALIRPAIIRPALSCQACAGFEMFLPIRHLIPERPAAAA